ncbi:MAG: hypothetical protein IJ366_09400 [Clostridia bacterium]|nr:hypothetical protein [Clostridia bacterium]
MSDYEYYLYVYFGSEIGKESELTCLMPQAMRYINAATFGKAQQEAENESVRFCACAVCDVLKRYKDARFPVGIESETVDGYSINYKSGFDSAAERDKEIARLCELYLSPELRYSGV